MANRVLLIINQLEENENKMKIMLTMPELFTIKERYDDMMKQIENFFVSLELSDD